MENDRQNDVLNIILDRMEQEGVWFTTKEDKLYANAKDLYKLDEYGELVDKSKERIIAEVEDYMGDGAAFVIEAADQWIQDNLAEGIIGYVDTLSMNFEIKPVTEEVTAFDKQGVEDLELGTLDEKGKEKKVESKKVTESFKEGDKVKINYISDENPHNGEVGTLTMVRRYKYYPTGDINEFEYRYQGEIEYTDGSTESISDLEMAGSGVISPVQKVANESKKIIESNEDYQEALYYWEDILMDCEKAGDYSSKEYKQARRKVNHYKNKLNDDNYYEESKKVESYKVTSYYDNKYRGVEDSLETEDISNANDFIWEKVQNGNYVEFVDITSGNTKRYTPDKVEGAEDVEDLLEESKITESFKVTWEYIDKKDNKKFASKGRFPTIEDAQRFVDELKKKPISKQGPTSEPKIISESKKVEEGFYSSNGPTITADELQIGDIYIDRRRDLNKVIDRPMPEGELGTTGKQLTKMFMPGKQNIKGTEWKLERIRRATEEDMKKYPHIVDKKTESKLTESISLSNLQQELYNKALKIMQKPEFGFGDDAKDYLEVSVEKDKSAKQGIVVTVRAELDYSGLMKLADELDEVIGKYDRYAYFDAVTSGILQTGLLVKGKITESNHGDFEAYKDYILDNLYVDSKTFLVDEEIIRDNINLIAEDTAKQVVAEVLDDQEYTGLYNSMINDYEKEIKEIILSNIDTIINLNNKEQQKINSLTEDYHVLGVKKDKYGNYSEEWIVAFDTEEECERFRKEHEKRYQKLGYESLSIASAEEYEDKYSYEIDYSDGSAWEEGDSFEVSNDEESFKITKRGNKWVDNKGNRFMGYLSPKDIMHYYKGYRIVESKEDLQWYKDELKKLTSNPDMLMHNASLIADYKQKINNLEKKEEKKTLIEGVRQRLNERNEQSAGVIEQALNGITDQTSEQEAGIITKTSELFQSLSDRGYDVQVSFDNGESTSSISIGQQGANVLITITDAEQPLRAFASGNFEINDDSMKMIKSIMEVLK